MDNQSQFYLLLIIVGVVVIGLVVLLYFLQRRKSIQKVKIGVTPMEDSTIEVDTLPDPSVARTTTDLVARTDDESVIVYGARNWLNRIWLGSKIKLLQQKVKEQEAVGEVIDAETKLLGKVEKHGDATHSLKTQPRRLERKDEIDDLSHGKKVAELKRDTAEAEAKTPTSGRSTKSREKLEEDERLAKLVRKWQEDVRIKNMKHKIYSEGRKELRATRFQELKHMIDQHAGDCLDVDKNPNLSHAAKKESLRKLDQAFINELDDFEKGFESD